MKIDFITLLGFDRIIDVNDEQYSDNDIVIQTKEFGIDKIHCSVDKGIFYPSVFFKYVASFDESTLQNIACIQRRIWNYKKVLFLYVTSNTEIRIYNCAEKPLFVTKDTNYTKDISKIELQTCSITDTSKLELLKSIFSRVAIDNGVIWTLEAAFEIRKRIDLQRRIDKYLVQSLVSLAKDLRTQNYQIEFIHKIIMRSLFLLYLEDRKATDELFYSKIKDGAKSYFQILDDDEATFELYRKLECHFKGSLFKVEKDETIDVKCLKLVKKCFISGYESANHNTLFEDWRIFDFSIIQIELLSEIYENFLSELDRKNSGAYYTPPAIVELILNDKLPIDSPIYNVKVLDPSCGSGIFLVESFKRLVKRYEKCHKVTLTDFHILKRLLLDNIYGIEINPQSIKVTAFSLYLALLDNLSPKTLWQNNELPNLINDADCFSNDKQGFNLFRRDTIETNEDIENIEFDLIVGNPPFGTKNLSDSIKKYCVRFDFAKEKVLPFLHKAISLCPKGEIALIFNTKILTNTGGTYQNFRRWLFNETYVEKIYNFSILRDAPKNFGGQLFGGAIGPVSVVFYRKENNISNDTITYYAPKTYIKSNTIEGVVIDSSDLKFIPRKECQDPTSKIWKIAMWGTMEDYLLLKRLGKSTISLSRYLENAGLKPGVGFETSNPCNKQNYEICKLPIHNPSNIDTYYTLTPINRIDKTMFRRLGCVEAYCRNHVIYNEGVKCIDDNLRIVTSYVDYSSAFVKGIVGIYSTTDSNNHALKLLTLFLNSNFSKYYAFLTTSSWGIERDVVKYKELFDIPYLIENISHDEITALISLYDQIVDTKSQTMKSDISKLMLNIDKLIESKLSEKDKMIIENTLLNLDLFHKQYRSRAIKPVQNCIKYIEIVCNEMNNFIDSSKCYFNATLYKTNGSPLSLVKLTFSSEHSKPIQSEEDIRKVLDDIDSSLWERQAEGIYFRKRVNYYLNDEIFIIRPNQQRFWTGSMAISDAKEIIMDILNQKSE